jgi:hypothetical protein
MAEHWAASRVDSTAGWMVVLLEASWAECWAARKAGPTAATREQSRVVTTAAKRAASRACRKAAMTAGHWVDARVVLWAGALVASKAALKAFSTAAWRAES